jgi:nitrate reductase gamma subunit
MLQPQAFIAFVLQYWAYILIAGFAAAVAGLWRRLADSERRAAAEKEQTFFLSILYIIMRSGKTLMHALAEAAGEEGDC